MNVLENYILEIYSEESVYYDGIEYIRASVLVNCYGIIEKTEYFTGKESWKTDKKRGYYLS